MRTFSPYKFTKSLLYPGYFYSFVEKFCGRQMVQNGSQKWWSIQVVNWLVTNRQRRIGGGKKFGTRTHESEHLWQFCSLRQRNMKRWACWLLEFSSFLASLAKIFVSFNSIHSCFEILLIFYWTDVIFNNFHDSWPNFLLLFFRMRQFSLNF